MDLNINTTYHKTQKNISITEKQSFTNTEIVLIGESILHVVVL